MLTDRRNWESRARARVRVWTKIPALIAVACALSCGGSQRSTQVAYDNASAALLHGELKQARAAAHQAGERSGNLKPEWAWRFRTLEARAMLQQGMYNDALTLLKSEPLPSDQPGLAIPILALEAEADTQTHNFPEAESSLDHASELCKTSTSIGCGYVLKARGLLAAERNEWKSAERLFELTFDFARSRGDALLESYALLNIGYAAYRQARFDEAIDRSEAGYRIAKAVGARRLELITKSNIAWAYYKLGDSEKALQLAEDANALAMQLGDVWNQESELIHIGYLYMDERKFEQAADSFQKSLLLARGIDAKDDIYANLRVMARLSLQTGDLMHASQYAQQAVEMARQDKNHLNELYPTLVQGQIAARRGETAAAESTFRTVESDPACPVFLKWEAEHALARLYEDKNQPDSADREYRAALATFESARDTVRHEDSQISFLTNASHIYDDYVHFLIARGKPEDALRWADFSRARTLADGLGILTKTTSGGAPALNAQQTARRTGATLLFYWLGEQQSYLWAIAPQKTKLFTLPPKSSIESAVEGYRKALAGPQDVLESAGGDGRSLYAILIAQAQPLLKKDTKVIIIPDGGLNNLNFETIVVPDAANEQRKSHYWIEDVALASASSLRVLSAAHASNTAARSKNGPTLLLVGNSVAPNDKYPELPKAATQMEIVAGHFPSSTRQVFSRELATPAAYLGSKTEQVSYIHFVAHGTASRLSPLESSIVLSKTGSSNASDDESFKLYARDILHHHLNAELVTISACYGAGERAYAGEGLVGLSWAFVRAGAHHVIGALWEVSDDSTPQLMDVLYSELAKNRPPEEALRTAKLSLLHSTTAFRKPFYWAPFQLYMGS